MSEWEGKSISIQSLFLALTASDTPSASAVMNDSG